MRFCILKLNGGYGDGKKLFFRIGKNSCFYLRLFEMPHLSIVNNENGTKIFFFSDGVIFSKSIIVSLVKISDKAHPTPLFEIDVTYVVYVVWNAR